MFERTVSILKEYVDKNCVITMESALVDDLGLSSLEVINIVAEFEDEFPGILKEHSPDFVFSFKPQKLSSIISR